MGGQGFQPHPCLFHAKKVTQHLWASASSSQLEMMITPHKVAAPHVEQSDLRKICQSDFLVLQGMPQVNNLKEGG